MQEVTTIVSRVKEARQFVRNAEQGYWIGLGGTQTLWIDDNNPPYPDPGSTKIHELHGLVYVNICNLVSPSASGSLYTRFGRYEPFATSSDLDVLVSNQAYQVYIAGEVKPRTLVEGLFYRILGLCSNVTFKLPVIPQQGTYVFADNVESYDLDWVACISQSVIRHNQTTVIQLVKSF